MLALLVAQHFFTPGRASHLDYTTVVLVGGVEKMTSQTTARVTEILAGAGDMSRRRFCAGATFPALFAMIARRHMHEFGTTREQLAAVAVKNHANGAKNPLAHMRKTITLEQALAGKPVSEPADGLRLLAHQRRSGGRGSGSTGTRESGIIADSFECWAWHKPPIV